MRVLLLCCLAMVLLTTATVPANATLLKNVRPGVMCKSADALAKLILPDGSSRSAGATAAPAYKAVAATGGCLDLDGGNGMIVIAKEIRKNTSIVLYQDYASDQTGPKLYCAANVDFVPYTVPRSPFNDAIGRNCPSKLEPIFVFDSSDILDQLDGFISTLPALVQQKIQRQTAGKCEAGWRCQYGAEDDALSSLGLDRQWADYLCKQPNFP